MPLRMLARRARREASSVPYIARFWNATVAHAAANGESGRATAGGRIGLTRLVGNSPTIAGRSATRSPRSRDRWSGPGTAPMRPRGARHRVRPRHQIEPSRLAGRPRRKDAPREKEPARRAEHSPEDPPPVDRGENPPTSGPTVAPPRWPRSRSQLAPRRPLGIASRSRPRPFGTRAAAATA